MAEKNIRDVNEEIWNRFVGLCKMKGLSVGEEISRLLDEYVSKEVKLKSVEAIKR